ncbi:MAG: Vps62-related protein [Desulfobacteraceae bacterium]|nr:Vps62-related protein [Desulfobacteraceae bacterium]
MSSLAVCKSQKKYNVLLLLAIYVIVIKIADFFVFLLHYYKIYDNCFWYVTKDLPVGRSVALAPPVSYNQIWNDRDSGGEEDGSIWLPVPPEGYTAIGGVAQTGNEMPKIENLRCVRTNLVTIGSVGELIWDDKNSGATLDISIWQIRSPGASTPGTFFPQAATAAVYVITSQ